MADDEAAQRGRYTAQDDAFLADWVAKDVAILGAYGLKRWVPVWLVFTVFPLF